MSYMHSVYNPKKHSIFEPQNPEKYIGRNNPVVRSGLEKAFCEMLDKNKSVIEWSSEPFFIYYMFQNKKKRYYPDFWVRVKTPFGEDTWLVEIKHSSESNQPTRGRKKSRKTVLNEKFTWEKNLAKWKAAKRYCNKMGWTFKVYTEKDLFK